MTSDARKPHSKEPSLDRGSTLVMKVYFGRVGRHYKVFVPKGRRNRKALGVQCFGRIEYMN